MSENRNDQAIQLLTEIRDELRKLNEAFPKKKTRKESVMAGELPNIAQIWNEWAHESLPRVISMETSSTRFKNCRARWESKPDTNHWISVIQRLNKSSFLLGKNDRKWKGDIEFLCRPDSAAKILEGKYDDKPDETKQKKYMGKWINPDTGLEEDFYA